MNGPPWPVLWTSLFIGLLADLAQSQHVLSGPVQETVCIVGPHALGYLVVAYTTLTLRAVMMRRNPLAFIFLCVLGACLFSLVAVSVIVLRNAIGLGPVAGFNGKDHLMARLVASLLTALSAAILLFAFRPLTALLCSDDGTGRRFGR